MAEYKQMNLSQLVIGQWYAGKGRNGDVGLWDGEHFLVIGKSGIKVGPGRRDWDFEWKIKREPFFTAESGCFQPFRRVDLGAVAIPHEEQMYATSMRYGEDKGENGDGAGA